MRALTRKRALSAVCLLLLGAPLLVQVGYGRLGRGPVGAASIPMAGADSLRSGRRTVAEYSTWLDSVTARWPFGIAPAVSRQRTGDTLRAQTSSPEPLSIAPADCPPELELQLTSSFLGHYFDSATGKTQIFTGSGSLLNRLITMYCIDSDLTWTSELTTADSGGVWLADDLDRDGNVDLVLQFADQLKIYSAPDWQLRARFVFPGLNVEMNPVAFNIDSDPYLELYVTPNTLGEQGMPTVIKYQELTDSFTIASQMWAPNGAIGHPAVGDFDRDGRVEFISGNNFGGGYEIFEWQESTLVYVGSLVDSLFECTNAISCRPFVGRVLHVLVSGDFGNDPGCRYFLYEALGDNVFSLVYVFEDHSSYAGILPSKAADVDCDGRDEILVRFRPLYKVWDWNIETSDFVPACEWNEGDFGTMNRWFTVDLDLNGIPEFASTSHLAVFRQFPDSVCVHCAEDGHCHAADPCACACFTDPSCDGVTNVLDVVHSVDVAFKNGIPDPDPFVQCPASASTDVDCSGFTDVLDVVHFVNVAFKSADPATEFCDPCP